MVSGLIDFNRKMNLNKCNTVVDIANKYQSNIDLYYNNSFLDAKRMIMVSSLLGKRGMVVMLTVEGADEQEAYNELYSYFKKNVG